MADLLSPDGSNATSADYYFDSYAHFGIHEEMIKDSVRTNSYFRSIEHNKHLFQDKIVLDVGCGTGILSMFAARAGAKKVFAVDCSSIAEQCKQIVEANGFGDVIEVIRGKMEEITLPVEHGYFLLYESMLDTVLYARDKYLRPKTGLILPDKAVMYMCGIEDAEYMQEKIGFWDSVYGFNMKVIGNIAMTEPLVDCVEARAIITDVRPILSVDILTCTKEDLSFTKDFTLTMKRSEKCHALVSFFDCTFSQANPPIVLSTSPFSTPTHWKQTVFYLNEALDGAVGDVVTGRVSCVPNARNNRDLDISIGYQFHGRFQNIETTQNYFLR